MTQSLSTPVAIGRSRAVLRSFQPFAVSVLITAGLAACSGSSGGGASGGAIGSEHFNPDGTVWLTETNEGGEASKIFIEEVFWGRLVDVYDSNGVLRHRDYLIGEDIRTDGIDFQLDINAVTEQATLTILHPANTGAYATAFDRLDQNLGPILTKAPEGDLPPFSFVPRNAAIGVRFSDMIDPATLNEFTLKLQVGNPPEQPFELRLTYDPNYGGTNNGKFYPTRALLDTTVSELEIGTSLLPLNSLGLPASKTTSLPNVAIRIPSQLDFGAGQFQILTNPAGNGLTQIGNGPVDFNSPGREVLRAMRSGGDTLTTGDANNGFLLDLNPPRLVGSQPVSVLSVLPDLTGGPDDYVVSFQFASLVCADRLQVGDVLRLPGAFAEATLPTGDPDLGLLSDVRMRLIAGDPIDFHPGNAQILSTFDKSGGDFSDCFVSFSPLAGSLPSTEVSPDAQMLVRFSEPMDPASLQPFDSFTLTRLSSSPGITGFVVGEVLAAADLKEFRFVPDLALAHTAGSSESYFLNLIEGGGVTDLAGNPLAEFPDQIEFSLDPDAATERNGGIVLRFNSNNEDGDTAGGTQLTEWAGQFLLDTSDGQINPRPVERSSAFADPTQAVPGVMIALTTGVQTPLSPLGSRMMDVYRYFDVGFSISDKATYNMDVEGLSWAPLQGQVQADFYEEFEINLAHSLRLPDEHRSPTSLLPTKPSSGLLTSAFVDNVLEDPVNGHVTMHEKALGYLIDPADLFTGGSGTKFMPYPVNRNKQISDFSFYTWRDTSIQAVGAPLGNGIPTFIEADVGLISTDGTPGQNVGDWAQTGNVPTIGLPLLMEFKCYPSDDGVGLNSLDCAIAINSSPKPTFRIFSTGGYDTTFTPKIKNPDTQPKPTGGFNANPALPQPLGSTTPPQDNVFYYGQLDLVVRVSRVYTRWLDTDEVTPDYLEPVLEPRPDDQPFGTELNLAFRGATGMPTVSDKTNDPALNADVLNTYGDLGWNAASGGGPPFYGPLLSQNPGINFQFNDPTWKSNIDEVDGARFLQARFTFISNTETSLNPVLSAFGVAFLRNS